MLHRRAHHAKSVCDSLSTPCFDNCLAGFPLCYELPRWLSLEKGQEPGIPCTRRVRGPAEGVNVSVAQEGSRAETVEAEHFLELK